MISLFIFMVSVTSDLVTRSWSIIFARSYNLIRPFSANQWPREKKRENKVFVLFVWGFFELQDGEATENWNKAQKMNWIDCCSCLSVQEVSLFDEERLQTFLMKKENQQHDSYNAGRSLYLSGREKRCKICWEDTPTWLLCDQNPTEESPCQSPDEDVSMFLSMHQRRHTPTHLVWLASCFNNNWPNLPCFSPKISVTSMRISA